MQSSIWAVALSALAAGPALADCLAEAKAAIDARLTALPVRETIDSLRDGEHQQIVLELASLQRFHTVIHTVDDGAATDVELLIIDHKGWSREKRHWHPFEATEATAASTADDERGLGEQLTTGATATCLGTIQDGGQPVIGYELNQDPDPTAGAPYVTLRLYVDPKTGRPRRFDMTGHGETGPATTHENFEYLKSLKLAEPK